MIELRSLEQIDEVIEQSKLCRRGVLIFKHSTRCGISSMVYGRFQRGWNEDPAEFPVYYLDLIRYREISNHISERFGVRHESPQVLLIRDGECVYHESHNAISPASVVEIV